MTVSGTETANFRAALPKEYSRSGIPRQTSLECGSVPDGRVQPRANRERRRGQLMTKYFSGFTGRPFTRTSK
jgi:hypothetical protein